MFFPNMWTIYKTFLLLKVYLLGKTPWILLCSRRSSNARFLEIKFDIYFMCKCLQSGNEDVLKSYTVSYSEQWHSFVKWGRRGTSRPQFVCFGSELDYRRSSSHVGSVPIEGAVVLRNRSTVRCFWKEKERMRGETSHFFHVKFTIFDQFRL